MERKTYHALFGDYRDKLQVLVEAGREVAEKGFENAVELAGLIPEHISGFYEKVMKQKIRHIFYLLRQEDYFCLHHGGISCVHHREGLEIDAESPLIKYFSRTRKKLIEKGFIRTKEENSFVLERDIIEFWLEGLARNNSLKELSVELEYLCRQMEELDREGAVHTIWTMMTPFIGAICNCQPADCLGLRTLSLGVETMFRGEMMASVDEDLCTGCGACQDACHFKAITGVELSGAYRARIYASACFGCGLCRNVCPAEALSMVGRA
jgi:ferredoxin